MQKDSKFNNPFLNLKQSEQQKILKATGMSFIEMLDLTQELLEENKIVDFEQNFDVDVVGNYDINY